MKTPEEIADDIAAKASGLTNVGLKQAIAEAVREAREEAVRACVEVLRRDVQSLTVMKMKLEIGSPVFRRLEARATELRCAADKLERTVLADIKKETP